MLNKIYIKDNTPGSLSNINEIKILICHTIKAANRPLDQNQLNEVFQINKTVNYFNFCAAVDEMLKTHHLIQTDDKKLSLTQLGSVTADLFKKNLPYSTVKKTLETLKQLTERDRKSNNRKTAIEQQKDGFLVKLTIDEAGTTFMDLKIFCINENEAQKFEKELKNKTIDIYKMVIAMLSNDYESLSEVVNKNIKRKNSVDL